jgi:hypothetical protein
MLLLPLTVSKKKKKTFDFILQMFFLLLLNGTILIEVGSSQLIYLHIPSILSPTLLDCSQPSPPPPLRIGRNWPMPTSSSR